MIIIQINLLNFTHYLLVKVVVLLDHGFIVDLLGRLATRLRSLRLVVLLLDDL